MAVLRASILSFTSPVAVLYSFHASRKAPDRGLAWIGLILSLIVCIFFVMATMEGLC